MSTTVWLVYNTDPKYMDSFLVAVFSNGQAARAFCAEQRERMTIDSRVMHGSWPLTIKEQRNRGGMCPDELHNQIIDELGED